MCFFHMFSGECTSCSDESSSMTNMKWTLPLLKTGDKRYYLGTFFKVSVQAILVTDFYEK